MTLLDHITTKYNDFIIVEKYPVRYCFSGQVLFSAINLEHKNQPVFQYFKQISNIIKKQHYNNAKLLLLGGGMYTYPFYLTSTRYFDKIEIVEIDQITKQIAQKYFFLDEIKNKINIIFEDGQEYLKMNKIKNKYDIIINDMFNNKQALNIDYFYYNDALTDNGIYIQNFLPFNDKQKNNTVFDQFRQVKNGNILGIYRKKGGK